MDIQIWFDSAVDQPEGPLSGLRAILSNPLDPPKSNSRAKMTEQFKLDNSIASI